MTAKPGRLLLASLLFVFLALGVAHAQIELLNVSDSIAGDGDDGPQQASYDITAPNYGTIAYYFDTSGPLHLSNARENVSAGETFTVGIERDTDETSGGGYTLIAVFTVGGSGPSITSATTASVGAGAPFSYTITASENADGFWVDPLPAGLTFNAATATISGSFSNVGTFSFTVYASNLYGSAIATVTVTVLPTVRPTITSPTTVWGPVGVAVNYHIAGNQGPTAYGATGLPSGLSVNTATGVISGTITATGSYTFAVSASNALGTGNATITWTVNANPVTLPATDISAQGFAAHWNPLPGASSYLVDLAADSGFTNAGQYSGSGNVLQILGLSPGLTYYYRVHAVYTTGISAPSSTVTSVVTSDGTLLGSETFTSTGQSSYTLPAGTNRVVVKLWAGNGRSEARLGDEIYSGGLGAYVQATYAASPGEEVFVNVGGAGGQYSSAGASAAWVTSGFQLVAGGGGNAGAPRIFTADGDDDPQEYGGGPGGSGGGGNGDGFNPGHGTSGSGPGAGGSGPGYPGGNGGGPLNFSSYGDNGGTGNTPGGYGGSGYYGGGGGGNNDGGGGGGGGGSNLFDTGHGYLNGSQFDGVGVPGPGAGDNGAVVILAYSSPTPPVIISPNNALFVTGQANTFNILATGIPAPTYAVTSGTLPSWATLNTTTGAITGNPPTTTGSPFSFTVSATNALGTVNQAFQIEVRLPQTIAFSTIGNRTFRDPPFELSATSSTGLPVTFSVSSGPAVITGTTVNLTGGGDVTIVATQAGNATYAPVSASQTFTVAKAAQTITFNPLPDRLDGDPAFTLTATSTSGLAVTYSIVSGGATVAGNTVTMTGLGTVTVRAFQVGNSSYLAATPVDQSFNISLSPAGHSLAVVSGTASRAGGNPGTSIQITATPSGTYFIGWVIDSGIGTIADPSNPNTTFTMGSTVAVVRATYTDSTPYYNILWTEINMPSQVVAGSIGFTPVEISGVVHNSGSAPWKPNFWIEVRNSSNTTIGMIVPGALTVGQNVAFRLGISLPSATGTYGFTLRCVDYFTNLGTPIYIGGTYSGSIEVTSRPQSVPSILGVDCTATVGTSFSVTPTSSGASSYSVIGTLPPGLSFNTSTGQISGTPAGAGKYGVTVVAASGSTKTCAAVLFNVYQNLPYNISVLNNSGTLAGGGTSGSLFVGASATVVARSPGTGEIFNGWTLTGPGTLVNPQAMTATVKLNTPGDLTATANYIPGMPITVIKGSATPMGGIAGANITLTADPDGDGTMFHHWSSPGPGTIANTGLQTTTFTIGATPATITANFVPGYRLKVEGGSAAAPGGLPGDEIAVSSDPTPAGYTNEGLWLTGPGYIAGAGVVMGKGTLVVRPWFWSTGVPLTRTRVYMPSGTNIALKNEAFTMTVATNYNAPDGSAVTEQQIDYSTDGGNTWILGAKWSGGPPSGAVVAPPAWYFNFTKTGGFPDAGLVVFRGRAAAGAQITPMYSYMPVTILNSSAATIVTDPASLSVELGAPATLGFVAVGDGGRGSVVYQWRKNGTDIPGKSGMADSNVMTELTIDAAQTADAGTYTVAIQSGITQTWVVSKEAVLTVTGTPPKITIPPAPVAVPLGGSAAFAVTATGSPTLSYQWVKGSTTIATSSSFTISSVQSSDAGTYTVTVSNGFNPAATANVTLTVDANAPTITSQPAATSVSAGASASFSVTATGPNLSYQWAKDGNPITGQTGSTLTLTHVRPGSVYECDYTVTVSNGSGSVTSLSARLTVTTPNPTGDDDGDGILNGVEAILGTDPTTTTTPDSTNQAQLKVHKP